jgi:ABC-type Mn2+/Zn2+ transport system permease subunit
MLTAIIAAAALGIACAVLSVFVVARRWAFMGEGIAHAGFGGAGTAWALGLLIPAWDTPAAPYVAVVLFCLATGLAIGLIHRHQRVNSDAAIGIFLVASLAWGFLAEQLYVAVHHAAPAGFDEFLFGQFEILSLRYALISVCLSVAILLVIWLLWKEILYYCLDPMMAEAAGVRAGFVHYMLICLITVTIILGVRIAGSVLVTAMLILPGATALLLARRLTMVVVAAVVLGLTGALAGPLLHAQWPVLPQGPMIVLTLFAEFVAVYVWTALSKRAGF